MKHRIFIAINLPDDVKNKLEDSQKKIDGLFQAPSPIRWTKKDNLHITLEFLGYVSDNELLRICQQARDSAEKHKPFTVVLDKICYGPPQKLPPRMIWAVGEKIAELNLIPHITLGRIKMWEFRQIEPEERPDVLQEVNLSFKATSLEVMESQLKKVGPDYTVLESCPFQS